MSTLLHLPEEPRRVAAESQGFVSTQEPSQSWSLPLPGHVHFPSTQSLTPLQAVPHLPQCWALVWRSTQRLAQMVLAVLGQSS